MKKIIDGKKYDTETAEFIGEADGGGNYLEELSEIRGIGGLKVERDLSFIPKPFSLCGV